MPEIELDDFDFGFTTHGDDEFIDATDDNTKAHRIYEAILPLLNNLAKDADKTPVIRWPDRAKRVSEFKKKLEQILNS